MALIRCVECGREISDRAAACIYCGCPVSASVQRTETNTPPQKLTQEHNENKNRGLSVDFNAVLSGAENGTSQQKVYVHKLGRYVQFPVRNTLRTGDTLKVSLQEENEYNYILFKAVSVSKPANGSSAAPANTQPPSKDDVTIDNIMNQIFGENTQNTPTVRIEAKLTGPKNTNTMVSVFVPEFNKTVKVGIPNSMTEGQTFTVSASLNSALNGINKPFKVYLAKVTHTDAPAPQTVSRKPHTAVPTHMDLEQKIKELKRRVYIKPIIRLFFSVYFLLSFAGLFLMMGLYPDGGAPDLLMNIIGIGFSVGFLSVFWFTFLPYIIGFYPDPNFFKTRKIMRHLEQRNLLEQAVMEMETCKLVPFGDSMCLSDSFLFPKKKNGVIIPCDELLWVYNSFSGRKSSGYLMLGTEHWGIQCFSRIKGRKRNAQLSDATIQALQQRNPSILVGETKENKKKYFQFIKN